MVGWACQAGHQWASRKGSALGACRSANGAAPSESRARRGGRRGPSTPPSATVPLCAVTRPLGLPVAQPEVRDVGVQCHGGAFGICQARGPSSAVALPPTSNLRRLSGTSLGRLLLSSAASAKFCSGHRGCCSSSSSSNFGPFRGGGGPGCGGRGGGGGECARHTSSPTLRGSVGPGWGFRQIF